MNDCRVSIFLRATSDSLIFQTAALLRFLIFYFRLRWLELPSIPRTFGEIQPLDLLDVAARSYGAVKNVEDVGALEKGYYWLLKDVDALVGLAVVDLWESFD